MQSFAEVIKRNLTHTRSSGVGQLARFERNRTSGWENLQILDVGLAPIFERHSEVEGADLLLYAVKKAEYLPLDDFLVLLEEPLEIRRRAFQ
jgi:hypothetical protein